jgi:hypothetical protein
VLEAKFGVGLAGMAILQVFESFDHKEFRVTVLVRKEVT